MVDGGEELEILKELPLPSLRVSFWPFSLSKPWQALCFVFNKEAVPFSYGMYSLKYPVPGAHAHRVGILCSRAPHFLCFHFSFQNINQTNSSCFWVWDVEGHTAGPSSRQVRRDLWKLPFGCPAMGGALFEWNLVLWRAASRLWWGNSSVSDASLLSFSFALTLGQPKPRCHRISTSWAADLQPLVTVNRE